MFDRKLTRTISHINRQMLKTNYGVIALIKNRAYRHVYFCAGSYGPHREILVGELMEAVIADKRMVDIKTARKHFALLVAGMILEERNVRKDK